MHPRGQEDARLVAASRAGDPGAFPALFEHWFDPCVDVAWRILRDRDAAADVAQETFLAAWRALGDLRDPSAFGGWVLRTARNRALNRLSRERRSLAPGEDEVTAVLDADAPDDEPGAAAARDENAQLVWAASAALGERDASVLDLHLRHGLEVAEIAETLGVTSNNAHQMLFRLRKRLSGAIRAWVLWHDGDPACPWLSAAIEAGGVTGFGAEAVRLISRHVAECDDCDARQQLRLAPEALFAAIPVVPAGAALRARAAAGLQAEGVPVAVPGAGAGAGGELPRPDLGSKKPDSDPTPESKKPGGDSTSGSKKPDPGFEKSGGDPTSGSKKPDPGFEKSGGDPTSGSKKPDPGFDKPGSDPSPGSKKPGVESKKPGGGSGGAKSDGAKTSGGKKGLPQGAHALVGAALAALLLLGAALIYAGSGGGDEPVEASGTSDTTGADDREPPDDPAVPTSTTTVPSTGGSRQAPPAEGPTTTRPAGGATADEPATEPSTADPPGTATDPTTTTSTSTTATSQPRPEPADPPVIVRFAATEVQPTRQCGNLRQVGLTWSSEGATGAAVSGPGAPTAQQPASGQAVACVSDRPPYTFTLTVTGPGGSTSASDTA